jgi:16S rRNA processing protein RimM
MVNQESPPSDQPYRLPATALVGIVVGPWGATGEVRIKVQTDNPLRFSPGSQLLANGRTLQVRTCRWHQGFALVRFTDVETSQDAILLQGAQLEVPLEEVPPLSPDSYYHFQVLDMEVWTSQGEHLGTVADILSTGSNDVYVVRLGQKEVLVPALTDVIVELDVATGRMTVDLPEGLR